MNAHEIKRLMRFKTTMTDLRDAHARAEQGNCDAADVLVLRAVLNLQMMETYGVGIVNEEFVCADLHTAEHVALVKNFQRVLAHVGANYLRKSTGGA